MIQSLKEWARELKREGTALYLAAKDPETPWAAKVLTWLVAAYALSPIDLIPDFIPILGYLDDLILIPIGVRLVLKMIPPSVMARAREEAARLDERPKSLAGTMMIVMVWVAALGLLTWKFLLR